MLAVMRRTALLVAVLLLGACGDDPGPQATQAPSPTPAATDPLPSPTEEVTTDPVPVSCSDETITGEPQVTVRVRDNSFSPECLIVLAGQGLELVNRGSNLHNFSVEGTGLDLDLESGAEPTRTEAIGGAVPPGTYAFFCSYHRSSGMDGEITVTDAG